MYMRFPGSCFSGCLCRSGFPQFPKLHYLGAASKKLIHLSFLLFVVDLSCIRWGHGILLKILLYCEGGPSLYSFLRKLKNWRKVVTHKHLFYLLCVEESWGTLGVHFWGKRPRNSCISTSALWSTQFIIRTEI